MEAFAADKLKSVLIGQPEELEPVCSHLNGEGSPELCSELRRLVENWQRSGPNLVKMLKEDRVLDGRVRHGRTLLVPTRSGKGHLLWLPNPSGYDARSWKDHALIEFMDLIVNPEWEKLGGPCHRCHKYYVKKTARQKAYCSRRCGSLSTAIATTKRHREVERAHKLQCAKTAAEEWTTVSTRLPWKKWVSARTHFTQKWLTRAVNRGDFREPKKHRRNDGRQ